MKVCEKCQSTNFSFDGTLVNNQILQLKDRGAEVKSTRSARPSQGRCSGERDCRRRKAGEAFLGMRRISA